MREIIKCIIEGCPGKVNRKFLSEALDRAERLEREKNAEEQCLRIFDRFEKSYGRRKEHMLEAVNLVNEMKKNLSNDRHDV